MKSLPLACCIAMLATLAVGRGAWASPEIPGQDAGHPVALVGGTLHPVTGPEIAEGVLLFAGGKIAAVGKGDLALPADVERIDIAGKHVYPGLIDAFTDLGLVEIPSVRATLDKSETGTINPNAKAQVAINPDSELIPVARANGVLTVLSAPSGGLMSGLSALVQLDGWTYEDMTVKSPAGLHITWPRIQARRGWWLPDAEKKPTDERNAALAAIKDAFAQARAYRTLRLALGPAADYDARWEALLPVLSGQVPIVVHADELRQIEAAVAFADHEQLKLILVGGYDAPQCAELLKARDVPVVVAAVLRLPEHESDAYDDPYTLPERLRAAGVRFCISGAAAASMVRNLPYHAAMAASFGLPPDEALKSITLYPAEIFGVSERLGSLTAGKDATLIVTSGDPLEITTQVERAFVQGRPVDLSNRQKRLFEKYSEKYRRLGTKD